MSYAEFIKLVTDAGEFDAPELYIADVGGSLPEGATAETLEKTWRFSKSQTARALRAETGLSRAQFARDYGIPLRTLENWDSGANTAPAYLLTLLAYAVINDR